MFGDLNRVTLMGNVTKDPELRYTPGGSAVLSFSIATNRRYKKGEEWVEEVAFHNIVTWNSAEELSKRVKKGTRLYVEGRLNTRSWDGADGKKNYKTEIVTDKVILIARYEGAGESFGNREKSEQAPADELSGNVLPEAQSDDDSIDPNDLPF